MITKLKAVCFTLAAVVAGLAAGCGDFSDGTTSANSATPSNPSSSVSAEAAALYAAKCADCHGALDVSTKKGITIARLQNAIASNTGGMGFLSSLTAAERQTIVSGLTPAATTPTSTVDGAALYTANCSGCHGALATSRKIGITLARLQAAIGNNTGGMGSFSTLTSAQQQAIVAALAPASTTPTTTPTTPAPITDGAALYTANCAGCHGALASSAKKGVTLARLQNAIASNTGGMSFLSTLTSAQQQAIVSALAPASTTPPPTTPPPTTVDGAVLYSSDCAGCHGALASSAKAGATAARIQTAINNNTGGMGSFSALTPTQVSAIAAALAGVTAPATPPPACGSCHAIPPATGHHSTHRSQNIACATCHGAGYSTTSFNAATHNNGVKNLTTTIGWNATNRSCSNSCHGTHTW
jgi:mono/diheme cytochrome c family protein